MTLGNMRELGVQHLIAYCLNDACRHTALIDVSSPYCGATILNPIATAFASPPRERVMAQLLRFVRALLNGFIIEPFKDWRWRRKYDRGEWRHILPDKHQPPDHML